MGNDPDGDDDSTEDGDDGSLAETEETGVDGESLVETTAEWSRRRRRRRRRRWRWWWWTWIFWLVMWLIWWIAWLFGWWIAWFIYCILFMHWFQTPKPTPYPTPKPTPFPTASPTQDPTLPAPPPVPSTLVSMCDNLQRRAGCLEYAGYRSCIMSSAYGFKNGFEFVKQDGYPSYYFHPYPHPNSDHEWWEIDQFVEESGLPLAYTEFMRTVTRVFFFPVLLVIGCFCDCCWTEDPSLKDMPLNGYGMYENDVSAIEALFSKIQNTEPGDQEGINDIFDSANDMRKGNTDPTEQRPPP